MKRNVQICAENEQKITDIINEAEKRARVRLITYKNIVSMTEGITDKLHNKLGVKKKDMEGISVHCDYHADRFPVNYRFYPQSTQFNAIFKRGKWYITSVYRADTEKNSDCTIHLTLTDTVKNAIIHAYEWM